VKRKILSSETLKFIECVSIFSYRDTLRRRLGVFYYGESLGFLERKFADKFFSGHFGGLLLLHDFLFAILLFVLLAFVAHRLAPFGVPI